MKPAALSALKRVAVITAHPDDESFGLGAVISTLVANGAQVSLTCLTRGEATTLGNHESIGRKRSDELECAAKALGVEMIRGFRLPRWRSDRCSDPGVERCGRSIDRGG